MIAFHEWARQAAKCVLQPSDDRRSAIDQGAFGADETWRKLSINEPCLLIESPG